MITVLAQSRGAASIDSLSIGLRVANALTSYASYLVKAVWPVRLAVFYPYSKSIPVWQWSGALVMLATATWLVVRAGRRRPYLPVGWLWYLGTLVPVIGLVQVGSQSMADRYTYVPLIGLFVMAVWGVADVMARWPGRRVVLPAAAGVIVIACTVATRAQVTCWQDAWTLWTHALAVTHDNQLAHVGLAEMLSSQGRTEEAVAHFREALRIDPNYPAAHRGSRGRPDEPRPARRSRRASVNGGAF